MHAQQYCRFCGNLIKPDWQFCENCGNKVSSHSRAEAAPTVFHTPVNPPTAQTPANVQSGEGKRSFIWLLPVAIGCIGVICICLFIVVGYFFLRRPLALSESLTPTFVSEIPISATDTPTPFPIDIPTATNFVEPTDLPTATESPPTQTAPVPTEEDDGLTGNQSRDEFSIFDDFSSKALGWAEFDDGFTIIQYEEEAYSFQVTEAEYFDWTYAPVDFWPNAIQFDAWGLPGEQEGTFGVFCQFQDIDNYYFVEIDLETHQFLMAQYLAGEFVPLTMPDENGQYWLNADPLKPDPAEANHIYLTCSQEFMVLSINDALVYHATVTDPFSNPGEMAFFVYTFSFAGPDGYKIFFDNVGIQHMIQ